MNNATEYAEQLRRQVEPLSDGQLMQFSRLLVRMRNNAERSANPPMIRAEILAATERLACQRRALMVWLLASRSTPPPYVPDPRLAHAYARVWTRAEREP